MTVTEGSSVDLRCKATADPLLELTYIWKRDGADITDESNIQWQEGGNVLKLSDISFEEAGVYTCVAYTPQPRGSEDNATAVVSIIGTVSPHVATSSLVGPSREHQIHFLGPKQKQ